MPAPTTEWVEGLKFLAPIVIPFATWLMGRASKAVTNQGKLDEVCKDVEKMRMVQDAHTITLAEHAQLHQGYVNVQRDVQKIGYSVERICGKLGVRGIGE